MPRIRRHRARPRLPAAAHQPKRQPLPQDKGVDRTNAEHHQRVAVKPVQQAPRPGEREILPDRQHIDVADATMIEVAGMRMVDCVGPSPKVIRRQGQHADHATDPIVGEAMPKKRAMAAVVLDHEQPHQKSSRGHRKDHAKPVADVESRPHREPQQRKRHHRYHDLDDTACQARVHGSAPGSRPTSDRKRPQASAAVQSSVRNVRLVPSHPNPTRPAFTRRSLHAISKAQ